MENIFFEWDENKSLANQKKHGISFEEAKTVFYDESARIIHDPDHSEDEDRFILLGISYKFRFLVLFTPIGRVMRLFELYLRVKLRKMKHLTIKKRLNKMRKEYDFSKSAPNPYTKRLKQQITIRLEKETIEYFKHLADEIDIPYQKLINLYLRNCAEKELKPSLSWQE